MRKKKNLVQRFINFLRFNHRKKLTIAIWFYTAYYRMIMLIVPSKWSKRFWGMEGLDSPTTDTSLNYNYAILVAKYIYRIADHTPWKSLCLVQALTARRLLLRKHIASTLYLGVGKDKDDKMIAHAWLRCGEVFVTGGNGTNYATVAKFATILK